MPSFPYRINQPCIEIYIGEPRPRNQELGYFGISSS